VQYLSIMIAGSRSGQSCEDWSKIGQAAGDENKYTITLNDIGGTFEDWFGRTRPQYMIIDPSGEFKNIDPDPDGCPDDERCGRFDASTKAEYDTLLAPYLSSSVPSPTGSPTSASPTTASPTASPTTRTPTVPGQTWSPTNSPITNAPTASPTTASPTTTQTFNSPSAAAAKNVFNVFASAVVFLFVTLALCVQL